VHPPALRPEDWKEFCCGRPRLKKFPLLPENWNCPWMATAARLRTKTMQAEDLMLKPEMKTNLIEHKPFCNISVPIRMEIIKLIFKLTKIMNY
jgi:hypothetical protein